MDVTHSLLSFSVAAGLLIITPGLDTAIVVRTATREGGRNAAQVALGVVTGCLVWGAAAAVGVGAVLAASAMAFGIVKWLGVAYLLWLGISLILSPGQGFSQAEALLPARTVLPAAWFWKGVMQNLLNPKVGLFYVSFLPQFLPPRVPPIGYIFLLAVIHAGLGMLWFAALVAATRPLVRLLHTPAIVRTMDRLTGCVLVGFGVKLGLSHR